mgnify:CR=1 FL=1
MKSPKVRAVVAYEPGSGFVFPQGEVPAPMPSADVEFDETDLAEVFVAPPVTPPVEVERVVSKLRTQKGIVIDQKVIPGANHFFDGKLEPLMETVTGYLDMRLANVR